MSSQAQVIYLNENNNAIFAIFSINLLTKIEREKYISNLFFIESKREKLSEVWKNIIAFFPFITKIDITVYNLICINEKEKRTRKKIFKTINFIII